MLEDLCPVLWGELNPLWKLRAKDLVFSFQQTVLTASSCRELDASRIKNGCIMARIERYKRA